jgi:hypothetical protein
MADTFGDDIGRQRPVPQAHEQSSSGNVAYGSNRSCGHVNAEIVAAMEENRDCDNEGKATEAVPAKRGPYKKKVAANV